MTSTYLDSANELSSIQFHLDKVNRIGWAIDFQPMSPWRKQSEVPPTLVIYVNQVNEALRHGSEVESVEVRAPWRKAGTWLLGTVAGAVLPILGSWAVQAFFLTKPEAGEVGKVEVGSTFDELLGRGELLGIACVILVAALIEQLVASRRVTLGPGSGSFGIAGLAFIIVTGFYYALILAGQRTGQGSLDAATIAKWSLIAYGASALTSTASVWIVAKAE